MRYYIGSQPKKDESITSYPHSSRFQDMEITRWCPKHGPLLSITRGSGVGRWADEHGSRAIHHNQEHATASVQTKANRGLSTVQLQVRGSSTSWTHCVIRPQEPIIGQGRVAFNDNGYSIKCLIRHYGAPRY